MAIEGAQKFVMDGLDQGFTDLVAREFDVLCKYPDPTSKMGAFLMAVQKGADVWHLAKAELEKEMAPDPPPEIK